MQLEGKKIILGITGSIAAYKSAILQAFVKEGACRKGCNDPPCKRVHHSRYPCHAFAEYRIERFFFL
jgi:dephospho-CoA kinase